MNTDKILLKLIQNKYIANEVKNLYYLLQKKNVDLSKITNKDILYYILLKSCEKFELFCEIFFPIVSNDAKFIKHDGVKLIIDVLQLVAERKIAKSYIVDINIMPRSGKTTICDTLFSGWLFARGDNEIIKTYTKSNTTSKEKHGFFNVLVKNELYKMILDYRNKPIKCGVDKTILNEQCFKTTQTIGTSAGGGNATLVILDDANDTSSMGGAEAEKVFNAFDKTFSKRTLGNKQAYNNIIIQQRLHNQDITGKLLETIPEYLIHLKIKEYEEENITYKIPLKDGGEYTFTRKAGHLINDPDFLAEIEKVKKEPYTYTALYQQEPRMAENEMLFPDNFFYFYSINEKPQKQKKVNCFITTDLSIDNTGESSDYTAIGYWEIIDKKLYLMDLIYQKFSLSVSRKQLVLDFYNKHKEFKPMIYLEECSNDNRYIAYDMRRNDFPAIAVSRSSGYFAGTKKNRLKAASQFLSINKIYIPIEYKESILKETWQITVKTIDKVHDDFCDMMADAIVVYRITN